MTQPLTPVEIRALTSLRYRGDTVKMNPYGRGFCELPVLTAPRFRVLAGLGLVHVISGYITISPAGVAAIERYGAERKAR